jgi:hypothetical protein
MSTRDDFTARVCRDLIGAGSNRMTLFPRSAVDRSLPSIPIPKPSPPPPGDPVATAAFIVAAGRRRRGEDNPSDQPGDNAPLRPGELVLNAIAKQRREQGK